MNIYLSKEMISDSYCLTGWRAVVGGGLICKHWLTKLVWRSDEWDTNRKWRSSDFKVKVAAVWFLWKGTTFTLKVSAASFICTFSTFASTRWLFRECLQTSLCLHVNYRHQEGLGFHTHRLQACMTESNHPTGRAAISDNIKTVKRKSDERWDEEKFSLGHLHNGKNFGLIWRSFRAPAEGISTHAETKAVNRLSTTPSWSIVAKMNVKFKLQSCAWIFQVWSFISNGLFQCLSF